MTPAVTRFHPRLPIFCLEVGGQRVLYAPGHLAVATPAEAETIRRSWETGRWPAGSTGQQVATRLEACARRAVERWRQRAEAPFAPECLTLYPSHQCNLACPYCYAASGDGGQGLAWVDEKAVRAAARWVARCCAEKGRPFHLVLHGGGEPTVHWDRVQRFVTLTRQGAAEADVSWFGYIATNGVLPEERARWLAAHFDLVGISCDGPPEIQDRQRPLSGGGASSPHVERTARVLAETGGQFVVRATITPQTVERQAEIVAYLHERLGTTQIRFEPVYHVHGAGQDRFTPAEAERFVRHFLAAQREAQEQGCELTFSGVRLDEVHGPYCHLLRDVLHLTPDGAATACFLCTDGRDPGAASRVIGRWDEAAGELALDMERIATLRRQAAEIPDRCRDCINAYHCARECPETCFVTTPSLRKGGPGVRHREEGAGFRCLIQRQLAEAWIMQAAEPLLEASCGRSAGGTS